ncbi:MAG: SCO family protein [Deltaproteobacteria bacterium]|nr:SCO family protein [Deltaproteobacteria bacterium]
MSDATAPTDKRSPPWRNPYVIGFVVGAVVLTVLPFIQRLSLKAPPPITSVGQFALTDETGKPFSSADLKGKVWIANFFFARCPSICPKMQSETAKILPHVEDLGDDEGESPVVLVSITVDPENDTPEVLAAYANKLQAPAGRWKFLTGDRELIKEVAVKRFLLGMGDKEAVGGDVYDIVHSGKLALVDQNGDVRGYWDVDEGGRSAIISAARLLAKHGPNP